MKIKLLLYLIIFLQGCVASKGVIGKYASKNPNYFQFKADSTYIYQYRSNHIFEHSSGQWIQSGKNMVLLNSKIKDVVVPLKVQTNDIKSKAGNMIKFDVQIRDGMDLSNYKCSIHLNDKLYTITRCDSLSVLQVNEKVNKFSLRFYKDPRIRDYTAISLPVYSDDFIPQHEFNTLIVRASFSDSLFFYKSFKNEVVKMGRNHIKLWNPYTKKWERILKTSETANIFSKFRGEY